MWCINNESWDPEKIKQSLNIKKKLQVKGNHTITQAVYNYNIIRIYSNVSSKTWPKIAVNPLLYEFMKVHNDVNMLCKCWKERKKYSN